MGNRGIRICVLLLAMVVLVGNVAEAAVERRPNPCDIAVQTEGVPLVGQEFDVVVVLSNAPDFIEGTLYLWLTEGLKLVDGPESAELALSSGTDQVQRFRVQLVGMDNQIVRATFAPGGKEGNGYETVQDEAFLKWEGKSVKVLPSVDYDFYRTGSVEMEYGVPTKHVTSVDLTPAKDGKGLPYLVQGQVRYRAQEPERGNPLVPLPFAKIRINNFIVCPPNGPCYPNPFIYDEQYVYTDENGFFYALWDHVQVQVSVCTETYYADLVINGSGTTFPETFEAEYSNPLGIPLNAYITIEFSEAAHILRNIGVTRQWCADNISYSPSKVDVTYYPGSSGTSNYSCSNQDIEFYELYGGWDEIWNERGRFVQAHEYGHHVMCNTYEGYLPEGGCPSPHYINSVSTSGCAWKEGWADFLGIATYVTPSGNEFSTFGDSDPYSFENLWEQNYGGYYRGTDGTNDDGVYVEGAVASFLWDIYDTWETNDATDGTDDDGIDGETLELWNLVRTARLTQIDGGSYRVQNIYHVLCVWNNVDPYPSFGFISVPYPGPVPVDDIYVWNLYGLTAPNLVAPEDGTIIGSPATPSLVCSSVGTADRYQFQIDDDPSFGSPQTSPPGNSYSFWIVSQPLLAGTYRWRARAGNAVGYGPWSVSQGIVVEDPPPPPALISPVNGVELAAPATVLLDCSDVGANALYQFQLDDAADFATPLYTSTYYNFNSQWPVPDPLNAGTYYWRARAANGAGLGDWASAEVFHVLTPPAAPTLYSPLDGKTLTPPARPRLNSNDVGGATGYVFEIDDDINFGSPLTNAPGSATSEWTVDQDLWEDTYYWRAKALNSTIPSPWSLVWHIVVAYPPPPDTLDPHIQIGKPSLPATFALYSAYPNPFNPTTTIEYDLPKACRVTLEVFNVLGQSVARLVNEDQVAGHYQVVWDAGSVASGVYLYRLSAEDFVETRKMTLLK